MQDEKLTSVDGIKVVFDQLQKSYSEFGAALEAFSEVRLKIDIPGFTEDDLDARFVNGTLSISLKDAVQERQACPRSNHIIAHHEKTRMALAIAEQMALSNSPVVLHGPIGVGKHLFARRIHQQGRNHHQPFTWFSCGAGVMPSDLLSAVSDTQVGTLYLDGLDELNRDCLMQVREIVASPEEHQCRIIAAINCSRADLDEQHHAVNVLLDSLPVCYIALPPLAQRSEDIEPLALYHLDRLSHERQIAAKMLSPDFLQTLNLYSWPGNVRELVNALDQVLMTARDKKTLFAKDLPTHIRIQTLKSVASRKMGL